MDSTLLLVEDDPRIQASLRLALQDEGHTVTVAPTGTEALERFRDAHFDIVLLDLMLPDIDGLQVCRTLRESSDTPVIMVTARTESQDIVAGLEAGADDYVTKPVVARELTARIRALLRRSRRGGRSGEEYRVGNLRIVPEEGMVYKADVPVSLTKTEFKLLTELAAHPGKVFSREELLRKVWEYEYMGDGRLVDVHIRRLRSKIEDSPSEPELLLTLRGLGYKLDGR